MKKIIASILLITLLISSIGCNTVKQPIQQPTTTEEPVVTNEPVETQKPEIGSTQEAYAGLYYEDFIDYLDKKFDNENYIASATSLRAALCLAIAGAEEDTLNELLKGAGFNSKEEAENWYNQILNQVKEFNNDIEIENKMINLNNETENQKSERAFEIVNSIWNNETISQGFKEEYINYVKEKFNSEANSDTADKLVKEINDWCNEKTRGMIPNIIDNVDDITAILVNALYLRTTWANTFNENATHEDEFTCKDGSKVTKEFMEQFDEKYHYYSDKDTQLVILPMQGNISFVCVIGDITDLNNKILTAISDIEHIHLIIPKLDIESTFNNEMVEFLKLRGVNKSFTGEANFNSMCKSEDWFISKIIQKAKIKSDEDGLEAAAVTAIMMETTAFFEAEEYKIINFTANEPFSFFIYSGLLTGEPEMLFCGHVVK